MAIDAILSASQERTVDYCCLRGMIELRIIASGPGWIEFLVDNILRWHLKKQGIDHHTPFGVDTIYAYVSRVSGLY